MRRLWVDGQADPHTGAGLIQIELVRRLEQDWSIVRGEGRARPLAPSSPRDVPRSVRDVRRLLRELWPKRSGAEAALSAKPPYPMRRIAPRQVIVVMDLRWRRVRSRGAAAYRSENLRRAGAIADAIVCISEATRRELLACYPAFADKTSVAHPGPGRSTDAALDADLIDRAIDLLLVGGAPHKRVTEVLEALLERRPRWVSSLAVVNPSATERALLDRIASYGVTATTIKHPSDTELAATYRRSRWVGVLGTEEGFGFVPFEALRAGANVAIADVPLSRELFSGIGRVAMVDATNLDWVDEPPAPQPGHAVDDGYSWDSMAAAVGELLLGADR